MWDPGWEPGTEEGGNGKTDAIQTEPLVQFAVLCQRPFPGFDNSAVIIPEATSKWLGEACSRASCTSLYLLCKSNTISELFFL